jgi:hypothetical protein
MREMMQKAGPAPGGSVEKEASRGDKKPES